MRYKVVHEIKGRLRIHVMQKQMTYEQADMLQYYLSSQPIVDSVKVREKTQDVTVIYKGDRNTMLKILSKFSYENTEVPSSYMENSGRKLNDEYWQKLVSKVVLRYGNKIFLPAQIRAVITTVKSIKYIWHGLRTLAKGKIEVPVLDATAIGVSILRADYDTAGSVMFLLGIGEILEEWTHKKSVDDLARSMSLNIEKVWLLKDEQQILVDTRTIQAGDNIVVHMGNVIPFDGVVTNGEALVNQSTLTGESLPVRKAVEAYVYAGTVVEEGELTINVKVTGGSGKFDRIVKMIEESEKLKSSLEGKAEHLADRLVPYTLFGTAATYLLTKNTTKALAVLMVDFSCALKLAMPISVLSAIREASEYNVTVKGGKYLEAMAEADTIVFDKTGTLTKANPEVVDVISFNGQSKDELLRIAACMEEHFPHSMAKAVVNAAKNRNLEHEEMHTKVEYVVAHGISTTINGKKAIIGSYHFVFEDEGCHISEYRKAEFDAIQRLSNP
jgi:cation transport ATPase